MVQQNSYTFEEVDLEGGIAFGGARSRHFPLHRDEELGEEKGVTRDPLPTKLILDE